MRFNQLSISLVWFFFVVICNVYSYFYILITGNLFEIYHGEYLDSGLRLSLVLVLILFFYFSIYVIFNFFSNIKFAFEANSSVKLNRRRNIFILVFILLVIYIFLTLYFGLGKAGGVELKVESKFLSFFSLFRVDYFALFFVAFFGLNGKTKLLLALFIISSFSRGWAGDIITLFILIFALGGRKFYHLFNGKYLFFVFVIIIFFPFIMKARSYYRLDGFEAVVNGDYSDIRFSMFHVFHEILIRFQQIYSIEYFFKRFDFFYKLYSDGYITPIYFEGLVQKYIYSLFVGYPGESLGYVFADTNRVLIEGRKTAFTPGVIPYFVFSPFSMLYCFFVVAVTGFLSSFFKYVNAMKELVFYFLITLFSFGWLNAYISFLFTFLLFLLAVGVRVKR